MDDLTKNSRNDQDQLTRLRKQAEAALRGQPVDLEDLETQDIQYLLHELQVHQVELSMQNEELRSTQQELEASRDQYLDLYNFAPAGYCTLDQKGTILEANQVLVNMLGVIRNKLVDSRLSRFISPEDQDIYYLHRLKAFESGSRQVDEIRIVNSSGERRYARLESIRDHRDLNKLRMMVSDITGRKQAEEALHATEERLQLATTAANIGIWDWNLPDGYFSSNGRFKTLFGLPEDEELSIEIIQTAVHPHDRGRKKQYEKELLASQNLCECEYRVTWPDESVHWIWEVGRSYMNQDQQPVHLAGVALDITRQKKHEALLEENAAELALLNQELQEFVFIASHDLQEPLRKIRSFGKQLLSMVDSNSSLSSEEKLFIERMQNAAERMRMMMENMLAYSRVTTKAEPYIQVYLGEVVQNVLSDLEIQLSRSGGQVAIGDLGFVEADPYQMQQLFQNLIGNALKFTEPGVPPRVLVFSRTREGDNGSEVIEIHIEDEGIGFDMAYSEQLFKPFQRLVGRSQYEGSGIGLAICRKIVERHGGKITAHSKPGQGSRFIVTLPVRQ